MPTVQEKRMTIAEDVLDELYDWLMREDNKWFTVYGFTDTSNGRITNPRQMFEDFKKFIEDGGSRDERIVE